MQDPGELLRSLRSWSTELCLAGRLTVLSALVAYWHGEPLVQPRPVDANLPLPPALGRVYSEIAARADRAFEGSGSGWVRGDPIVIFNRLRDPSRFEVDG